MRGSTSHETAGNPGYRQSIHTKFGGAHNRRVLVPGSVWKSALPFGRTRATAAIAKQ
jgi:hypothetical protein